MSYFRIHFLPLVLSLLAMASPMAWGIPIIDEIAGDGRNTEEYLSVVLNGRGNTAQFGQVNQLIALGAGAELVSLADQVLSQDRNSALAFEVRGVGQLIQRDISAAISDFEQSARLDPSQSGALGKLGLALMEDDQVDAAVQAFNLALLENPSDAFAHRNIGLLYDYLGETNSAITSLARGLRASPTGFVFETSVLARLLLDQNRPQDVITLLASRLAASSTNEAALSLLGRAYVQTEQWGDALAIFDRALLVNPSAAQYQMGKAVALRGLGQFDQSISLLKSMQGQGDLGLAATTELAMSYLAAGQGSNFDASIADAIAQGANADLLMETTAKQHMRDARFAEAVSVYQELTNRGQGTPQAYVDLAELLFADQQVEASLAVVETSLETFPSNSYVAFRAGNTFASVGRYEAAIDAFTLANALTPNSIDVLRGLSLSHARIGNHRDALAAAQLIMELAPNNFDLLVFGALAYERAGDTAGAIRAYEQSLAIQSNNPLVQNNLANLLLDSGEIQRAASLIESAVATVDNNPLILDTFGKIKLQQGELSQAKEALEKAVGIDAELGVVHYHLGLVYLEMDNDSDARAAFTTALSLSPAASWAADATSRLDQI